MVNTPWFVRDFICVKIINIYNITLSCILYNILYDNGDVCSKHIAEKPDQHVNYQCNHLYASCFHRCHRRQNCGVNKIKSSKCFVEGEKDVLFIAVLVGWCVREQNTAIVLLRFSVPSYFHSVYRIPAITPPLEQLLDNTTLRAFEYIYFRARTTNGLVQYHKI